MMKTSSLNEAESTDHAKAPVQTESASPRQSGHWPQGPQAPDANQGFDRVRQGAPRADDKEQYRGQSGYGGLAASNSQTEHQASEHRTSAAGQQGSFGEANYGGELGQSGRGGVSSYGNSSGSRYSIDNEQDTSSRTLEPMDSFGKARAAAPVSTNVGQYAGEYDDNSHDTAIHAPDLLHRDAPVDQSTEQSRASPSRDELGLQEQVAARLADHPHLELRDVSVSVVNKIVHLEGTVPQRRMKHAIEDVADNVDGVLDVENRIKVRRPEEAVATFGSGYSEGQAYANASGSKGQSGPVTFGAASAKAAAEKKRVKK